MGLLKRLLAVHSIADSVGFYVPAKMLQKALGFVRLLLLTHLIGRTQCGLWGLGMMLFTIAAPLLALGASHGLTRYVVLYEARGRLCEFYRRMRWAVPATIAVTLSATLLASDRLTDWVIVSRMPAAGVSRAYQRWICWAALANAGVLAVYYCMLGVMYGLRTYRLAAAVEFLFGVAFTGGALAAALFWPTGLTVLWAHLGALVVGMLAGLIALERGLESLARRGRHEERPAVVVAEPEADGPAAGIDRLPAEAIGADAPAASVAAMPKAPFARVLGFGLISLLGTSLWAWAVYVSFWMTNKALGPAVGGVYFMFLSLGQPVLFVADALWAVVFTHVARRWETDQRREALQTLETAYRSICLALMTLTILVLATGPLWVRLLRSDFQSGLALLPGLMLFFQAVIHLALMSILARLQERPAVIALAATCGIGLNWLLGGRWLVEYGPAGAAWAAGVGAYVGATVVTAGYFLLCRIRFAPSTYLMVAAPVLLLALLVVPLWVVAAVWAGVLAVAVGTDWILDRQQKQWIVSFLKRLNRLKRRTP